MKQRGSLCISQGKDLEKCPKGTAKKNGLVSLSFGLRPQSDELSASCIKEKPHVLNVERVASQSEKKSKQITRPKLEQPSCYTRSSSRAVRIWVPTSFFNL